MSFQEYSRAWCARAEAILSGIEIAPPDEQKRYEAFIAHMESLDAEHPMYRMCSEDEEGRVGGEFVKLSFSDLARIFREDDYIFFSSADEDGRWSDYSVAELIKKFWDMREQSARKLTQLHIDDQQLSGNTHIFGAKSANVTVLRQLAPTIEARVYSDEEVCIRVPESIQEPVSTYETWKRGEDISAQIVKIYGWTRGKAAIIRSSGREVEDGDKSMSPGIFKSVQVAANHTIEDLRLAVIEVYTSAQQSRAVDHLLLKGLAAEVMGLEIQEYVDSGDFVIKGNIDTSIPHRPELLGITMLGKAAVPPLHKDRLIKGISYESPRMPEGAITIPLDNNRHERGIEQAWWHIAQTGLHIEQAYQKPVQIEFIVDRQEDENRKGKTTIWLLQARPLPVVAQETTAITFPEHQNPICSGRAIGHGDVTLDVLSVLEDNGQKEGIVPVSRSFLMDGDSLRWLPRRGGVVIDEVLIETHAHLPWLCLDKGLFCIFREGLRSAHQGFTSRETLDRIRIGIPVQDPRDRQTDLFHGHTKLRVVMDGVKGHVYAINEVETPREPTSRESWIRRWWNAAADFLSA